MDRTQQLTQALARRNPVTALRRSIRRFARRPRAMQLRTIAVVVATIGGLVIYVANAPTSAPGPDLSFNSARAPSPSPSTRPTAQLAAGANAQLIAATHRVSAKPTPVSKASTSARGVSKAAINVVFPIVNLQALAAKLGFATDIEFTEQAQAIKLYVNEINSHGGINGRQINAIIVNFDPTDESNMRSLCKDWTEGTPAAFAVLDGVGAWTSDNQLCITQEGRTPMIGAWSTVTKFTQLGSPYLWWTGPDQAAVLASTVAWAKSAGLIGKGHKLGIIAGDRASDQLALHQYLLPVLHKAGITPEVQTIAAGVSESATASSQAPLVIQKLRAAGVQSVLPLIPFNVFFPLLEAETEQEYFPKLLLSDYENSIQSGLGLVPIPYQKALDGQRGVTTQTLGGIDDDRPQSEGGYDPAIRSCFTTWHAAYPEIPKGQMSFYIEEQGPVVGWCQAVRLFAKAATAAGPKLNRRTFVQSMAKLANVPGAWSPTLSYGPNRFAGPTQYQVVKIHNNDPSSTQCKMPKTNKPQVTCWVTVQGWKPLVSP